MHGDDRQNNLTRKLLAVAPFVNKFETGRHLCLRPRRYNSQFAKKERASGLAFRRQIQKGQSISSFSSPNPNISTIATLQWTKASWEPEGGHPSTVRRAGGTFLATQQSVLASTILYCQGIETRQLFGHLDFLVGIVLWRIGRTIRRQAFTNVCGHGKNRSMGRCPKGSLWENAPSLCFVSHWAKQRPRKTP